MHSDWIEKYARLLVGYCCDVKPGQRVLIRSTYLAQDLILACQRCVLKVGATCEFDISIPGLQRQSLEYSSDQALKTVPILYETAVRQFDVMISIHAPFDIFSLKGVDESKLAISKDALKSVKSVWFDRGKTGNLRWVICNYPTQSLADVAQMRLDEYAQFIAQACFLTTPDPAKEWRRLSDKQQTYVDCLNQGSTIRFVAPHVDITFGVHKRRWINSDGKRNMPSGEVFTSPIESSANGTIQFDHPSLLFGEVIQGLKMTLKDGKVVQWESETGHALLARLFKIPGADYVGEIAIGTNDGIQVPTLNTLFDEKIGGTIHMAVGASYPETGGKNKSSIHHDFVTSFKTDSYIMLDDHVIYKNGCFVV